MPDKEHLKDLCFASHFKDVWATVMGSFVAVGTCSRCLLISQWTRI